MTAAFISRWRRDMSEFWLRLLRRDPPHAGPIRLDRRRVYVLPTRAGMLFTFVLLAMLIGAINYNNSLAYALTFLLASLTVVSILHTFRNLHGLTFHVGHPSEVFAGSSAPGILLSVLTRPSGPPSGNPVAPVSPKDVSAHRVFSLRVSPD